MAPDNQYALIEEFLRDNEKSFLLLSAGRKVYDRTTVELSPDDVKVVKRFLKAVEDDENRLKGIVCSLGDKGEKSFTYMRSRDRVSSSLFTCEYGGHAFKSFRGRGGTLGWSLHKLQKEVDQGYELPEDEYVPEVAQRVLECGWNIRVDPDHDKFLFTTFAPCKRGSSNGYLEKEVVGSFDAPSLMRGLVMYESSGLERSTIDAVVKGFRRPAGGHHDGMPSGSEDMVLQLYHIGAGGKAMDALYAGLKKS